MLKKMKIVSMNLLLCISLLPLPKFNFGQIQNKKFISNGSVRSLSVWMKKFNVIESSKEYFGSLKLF